MMLTALALAHLLNRAAPQVAPGTMAAVVMNESGGNPYAIHDNVSRRSYWFRNAADARAFADAQLALPGANLDLGIAQINFVSSYGGARTESYTYRDARGRTASVSYTLRVDDAFDPRANLTMGGVILTSAWNTALAQLGPAAPYEAVMMGAFEIYNSNSLYGAPDYADAVVGNYNSAIVRTIAYEAYLERLRALPNAQHLALELAHLGAPPVALPTFGRDSTEQEKEKNDPPEPAWFAARARPATLLAGAPVVREQTLLLATGRQPAAWSASTLAPTAATTISSRTTASHSVL